MPRDEGQRLANISRIMEEQRIGYEHAERIDAAEQRIIEKRNTK